MSFSEKTRRMVFDAINEAGITQRELGRRMGITESAVSLMLYRKRSWSLKTVDRILAALA
jgi:transcriptional regulator with XRE-family HTH domain